MGKGRGADSPTEKWLFSDPVRKWQRDKLPHLK
jgi:hypothetical protein